MWKVSLIGVIAVILCLLIKQVRPELSSMLSITAGIIIFFYSLACISSVMSFIKTVVDMIPIDNFYIYELIKMLGVTYVAEFAENICKDAGYQAVACQIEIFAKLTIVIMSVPIINSIIMIVEELG